MLLYNKRLRQTLTGYAFLAPNIIGFLTFTFLPVLASLGISFTDWDLIHPPHWVGLKNFERLLWFTIEQGKLIFNDPNFWKYFYNTVFLMGGIPFGIFGSLMLAMALNKTGKIHISLRTIYFLPSMCVPVAIFLVWRWIYDPDVGLFNWILSFLGIKGPNWLSSTFWAKPAIVLTGLWVGIGGYNMILYLAGLQEIPRQFYEAAEIDGANAWQRFRYITWPMLAPTTFFIVIMSLIAGFQGGFEAAYMMTRGGPAGSTITLTYYIYNNIIWLKMGYAAAIAWVLFVLIFTVTLFSWRYGGRKIHYVM
ncbi:sugar ABC transporter permease [Candidatus Sumerlaeota bacterium]|nr:sugar ABC transporter permease [Candidatus Sumerlaeota bacterium]